MKDYDVVGPEDFHLDRKFDQSRDSWGRPWFLIKIIFHSTKPGGSKMEVDLVFPLDEKHLQISTSKRSFRASQPKIAKVNMEDSATKDCSGVTISFQVQNSYIKYILSDP